MDSNSQSPLPLVLIHAFPLSGAMWQPQHDALDSELVLLTPDLPGFGSEPGLDEEELSMDRLALYIARLLDARGIDRFILGGLSLGGYVAFACLRSMRERIAGLILANTTASADDEAKRAGRIAAIERIGAGEYDAYCEALLQKLLAEETRRGKPELVDFVRRMMLAAHPEAASAALLGMLARPDSHELLASIDVPTVVIAGQHDAIMAEDDSRAMASGIPDATLHVIPGAGHLSNLENPEAFNAAVRDLVARVRATVDETA